MLTALGVLMMGCSPAPPPASPPAPSPAGSDSPAGERPDPAIADLDPVALPRPLVGPGATVADLPVVAIVTGLEAVIAVHLSPGRCAAVVASSLADSGTDARFSVRVDAPVEGQPAESKGGDLPEATGDALGPANLAVGRLSGGPVVLYCGARGAAVWLEGVPDPVKVTGAGRARPTTIAGNSGYLVVVAPPATVEAALPR